MQPVVHLAGRRPHAAAPILLLAHLDVVPAEDPAAWTHPPFAGHVADGYVWGRGALDMKSAALGILEAVEQLVAEGFRPARTVYVAMGHDEEVGGAGGNAQIAARLAAEGAHPGFVLDEGGAVVEGLVPGVSLPVALVGIAEKGILNLRLSVLASGGHASMPPPQTAIGVLAAAIERLESRPMPARIDGAAGSLLDYLGPEMPLGSRAALANRWLFGPLVTRQLAQARPPTPRCAPPLP